MIASLQSIFQLLIGILFTLHVLARPEVNMRNGHFYGLWVGDVFDSNTRRTYMPPPDADVMNLAHQIAEMGYSDVYRQANPRLLMIAVLYVPNFGFYLSSSPQNTAILARRSHAPRWELAGARYKETVTDLHAEDGVCWFFERSYTTDLNAQLGSCASYPAGTYMATYGKSAPNAPLKHYKPCDSQSGSRYSCTRMLGSLGIANLRSMQRRSHPREFTLDARADNVNGKNTGSKTTAGNKNEKPATAQSCMKNCNNKCPKGQINDENCKCSTCPAGQEPSTLGRQCIKSLDLKENGEDDEDCEE